MGYRPRFFEPHLLYSAVTCVVDRQFAFKPNHSRHNHLLAAGCPPESLSPDNDLIPEPSVINIIGYAVGRALQLYPVDLRWFAVNINHIHSGFTAPKDQFELIPAFYKTVNSLIARGLNELWERDGHFFASRPSIEACTGDLDAKQQLLYAIGNPVKDGQVETVNEAPFFSTFRHHASGKPLRFWKLDYNAWWQAGGPRNRRHRLKDYLCWVEYELLPPLPEWEGMPEHKWSAQLRALTREMEAEQRKQRRVEGRGVIGVPALFRLDPRDRPATPRKASPQPLCHASTPQAYFKYARKWRDFIVEYRKASHDYRNGDYAREFPAGSFRPPLVTPRKPKTFQ